MLAPHFLLARRASVNSSSPDMIEYIVVNRPKTNALAPGGKTNTCHPGSVVIESFVLGFSSLLT
jgi:hypothetical protein